MGVECQFGTGEGEGELMNDAMESGRIGLSLEMAAKTSVSEVCGSWCPRYGDTSGATY